MEFNNKENEVVTKENIGERKFWISRSPAIVVSIIINNDGNKYVLMGQRGEGTPDFQEHWNMICGYLDWNESGTEAAYREVWEESGFDLKKFLYGIDKKDIIKNDLEQPWFVNHYPDSNRENLTLRFGVEVNYEGVLPLLSAEHCEPGEVSDLGWLLVENVKELKCAFNHDTILMDYVNR